MMSSTPTLGQRLGDMTKKRTILKRVLLWAWISWFWIEWGLAGLTDREEREDRKNWTYDWRLPK